MNYQLLFEKYREQNLFGRYITNRHIEPLLETLKEHFEISVIGESVKMKPIYQVKIGSGKTKIYMWSQMHGNESTCTKALFDLFNFLKSDNPLANQLKKECTLLCIPIVNPDGAEAYTRVNTNEVDLNRDSVNLSQPESRLLRKVFDDFQPDFCFNLHDQRTIFAAGFEANPATVSFLAPSYNEACEINEVRLKAINIIVAMYSELKNLIPGQVGQFDDAFNINCIGDRFQSLNVPTILFEAGHFQNDYDREVTRKFIFVSYLSALSCIMNNEFIDDKSIEYFKIPQNNAVFFDFIYKNVKIIVDGVEKITNFAAHYKEVLANGKIEFEAKIVEIGALTGNFGHVEYDFQGELFENQKGKFPQLDQNADFLIGTHNKIVNGLLKK
ncbi:M14 family metallopeptidase [Flavobacterium suncheonense]|uniref:M14 family metallopeptidase n=1 Tax=Flavobacterium suncheonense TaxID=350894 RepID=UPI003FA3BF87